MLHRLARHLADTLVIKEHRHAAFGDEDGHAVPQHQGFGVIHLKAMTAYQLDGKHLKWRPSLEGPQRAIEVVDCHAEIITRVPIWMQNRQSVSVTASSHHSFPPLLTNTVSSRIPSPMNQSHHAA